MEDVALDNVQFGILEPVPSRARFLFFSAVPAADYRAALRLLGDLADGVQTVVGLGPSLVRSLGGEIEGLRSFPPLVGGGIDVPSTPMALWCWLRGDDQGELWHRSRLIERSLIAAFRLERAVDSFRYGIGRDLTGYEDGTENPVDAAAVDAAIVRGRGAGLDGSSFVAVQQWVHDFDRFESMDSLTQDHAIGRRRSDNQEIEDAPPSAHIRRTAQEEFSPAAFIVRRSMPWSGDDEAGLVFVAFGKSFDAFEAQMHRMVGADDGIADALFGFTRPVTGSYFWCPPLLLGRLNFSALGR